MDQNVLDIQAQQQHDSLLAYNQKATSIQVEIKTLEGKRDILQELLDEAFAKKIAELNTLEDELRRKLEEVNNSRSMISRGLDETLVRLKNIKELEIALEMKHQDHQVNLDAHHVAVDELSKDIAQRLAVCIAKEESACNQAQDVEKRLLAVEEKERDIEDKANKLVHIANNINEDIVKQTSLKNDVQGMMDALKTSQEEITVLRNKVSFERSENEQLRSDLDKAFVTLANRKKELDQKEHDLKAYAISLSVSTNQITDRENAIKVEISRLNDLKNNVETLMKQQANKGV